MSLNLMAGICGERDFFSNSNVYRLPSELSCYVSSDTAPDLYLYDFKALAKRTRKSTQGLDLRSTCVSFGHPLATTSLELR